MLTLLTGGARSGKSSAALALAARSDAAVTYIATAEAGDDEMADRIARHRAERSAVWTTIEAPRMLAEAVSSVVSTDTLVVDCLALWVTNLLPRTDVEIELTGEQLISTLRGRSGRTYVVTNEVGSGIVPDNALARRFRDLLGGLNQRMSSAGDRTLLCVAGGIVETQPLTAMMSRLDDV
jgi:adenosylcobinamide kinase/adenosylcobinamide-phosphate guanylyltransferase